MNLWQALVASGLVLAMPLVAAEISVTDRVDAIVAPYLEARDFMGVVGVQRDGEEALLLPCGLASVELEVPQSA
jgi:hypothetical protein